MSSAAVVIGALRVKWTEYMWKICKYFYKGNKVCDLLFAVLHTKLLLKNSLLSVLKFLLCGLCMCDRFHHNEHLKLSLLSEYIQPDTL